MRIDAHRRKAAQHGLAMVAVVALAWGCTEQSSPSSPSPASGTPGRTSSAGYTVGGTVGSLSGSGLILQNNGTDDLAVGANGSFTFTVALASGDIYSVSVRTQPSNPAQACVVTHNATGTIANANVTNVAVHCDNIPPTVSAPPTDSTAIPAQHVWEGTLNTDVTVASTAGSCTGGKWQAKIRIVAGEDGTASGDLTVVDASKSSCSSGGAGGPYAIVGSNWKFTGVSNAAGFTIPLSSFVGEQTEGSAFIQKSGRDQASGTATPSYNPSAGFTNSFVMKFELTCRSCATATR